ncbi:hypothetical protein SLNWT_4546 [Streptomyces albus]|uniref:Uncharacterized protein n=1 Tax=Streptomyces albus (strain ATCC 21838 / DSM 41398 / FERM P-419 / JCM 4703 / NBRC 107858) TaxID=1081613 RepID=A0A0B5F3Q9_STRA4|nr:hypothetical protein SLNWT_4546 [Streptomyces albus]AOU79227.1 hypothetical protein SLNHY_4536 [Streptomyces albus]
MAGTAETFRPPPVCARPSPRRRDRRLRSTGAAGRELAL